MKLATLKSARDGAPSRDGRLVVVSSDLTRCTSAELVAPTLQAALDRWEVCLPALAELAEGLAHGAVPDERFHERDAMSPLPRAYQWADGSAYLNHAELVRRARGAELPAEWRTDPLMYQGGSDAFLGPREPIPVGDIAWGVDFEGELAVIVDDVPMGADRDTALAAVRLVMLANDVSLRNLVPGELAKGFGFFHAKPSTAFSPVAVTPDELGVNWRDGRLHLPLIATLNGRPFGSPDAGVDMTFDFGRLIQHAARTRRLSAGTIIGSGTVSNRGTDGGPGKTVEEGGVGYTCIAEVRAVETIRQGKPVTPFMAVGDIIRLEMKDDDGHSVFGAIEQAVVKC